jgi:ubiquinone biosynthesis protein UbiJ
MMIPVLVNAIKELMQEVEELKVFKNQYENLIARIEDLENK